MSLDSRLSELRRKHEMLSTRIEQEQRRPAADDFALASLKKEKLRLKEEIARLATSVH